MDIDQLRKQSSKPLKGKEHQLSGVRSKELLALLPGWEFVGKESAIRREFKFPDFAHALAFVNAVGWIAERENHHPDIEFGWGRCSVAFSTHDVGGLSMNDFISAAKVDALFAH